MRQRCLVVLLLLSAAARTEAHSDPLGETHPRVQVEGDRFVVRFKHVELNDQRTPGPRTADVRCIEVVHALDGAVLVPRREVASASCARLSERQYVGPGSSLQAGSRGDVAFPPWHRLHHGRPWYQRLEAERPGPPVNLAWPDAAVDVVDDMIVAGQEVIVLASPFADTSRRVLSLSLFRFGRDGAGPPRRLLLAQPKRIYAFPIVSDIGVVQAGEYAVALMSETGDVLVTSWNTRTGATATIAVARGVHWNAKVAMATHGRRALVAYHSREEATKRATVKVHGVFLRAP